MDHAKKKIATKVDRLQIEAQCLPKVCKPILVRLANSIIHKILGMEAWGVGLLASSFHLGKGCWFGCVHYKQEDGLCQGSVHDMGL